MEFLPERVRLIAAHGELRDVVLAVLGWSTDDATGETVNLAVLDGDRLRGMIFFHQGDESEFEAEREDVEGD